MRDRDDPVFEARQGQEIFLFSKSSRPVEGRTKPPTQWVPGFFFFGGGGVIKRRECEVVHLHLVSRRRISGAVPSRLDKPSWQRQRLLLYVYSEGKTNVMR